MLNIPHTSKMYPFAVDLHLLHPTCTLPLLDAAAAWGEPCRGLAPQRCCMLAAQSVWLPVLLQAAACHLQCSVCSSHCGRVTPRLVQRQNKKSVRLSEAAISKTRASRWMGTGRE